MAEQDLKEKLRSVMNTILEEDDAAIDKSFEAIRLVSDLAELKLKKTEGDLVNLPSVENLSGDEQVQQVITSLLARIHAPTTLSDQKLAAKELRELTEREAYQSGFFEIKDALSLLLEPLLSATNEEADFRENLILTVFNLSLMDDHNKIQIANDPQALATVLKVFREGPPRTMRDAAFIICSLSCAEDNRGKLAEEGVLNLMFEKIKSDTLVDEIKGDEVDELTVDDLLTIVAAISTNASGSKELIKELKLDFDMLITFINITQGTSCQKNCLKILRNGAIAVMLQKIKEATFVDDLLATLAKVSTHSRVQELGDLDNLRILIKILKQNRFGDDTKKWCIEILYNVSYRNQNLLQLLREEGSILADLAGTGTTGVRLKASDLLKLIHQAE